MRLVRTKELLGWVLFAALFATSSLAFGQKKEDKKADSKKADTKAKADAGAKAGATKPADAKAGAAKPADAKAGAAGAAKPADAKAAAPTGPKPTGERPDQAITNRQRFQLVKIEEETNSLKEKIFRSKAQLLLLQESLLHGAISTAKLVLRFENQMGGSFYLKEVQFALDGTPLYTKTDYNGSLNNQRKLSLYKGSIQPKQHTLSIVLIYKGNGFGVFSYLSKLKFKLQSSYTFKAEEKKQLEIRVVAFEKNWLTTPLKQRPSVKYVTKVRTIGTSRKKIDVKK